AGSSSGPQAGIRCLGTAGDSQLQAYGAYSLALAGLGGALPLLLTLAAYGALVHAVLRSHGTTVAEKLRVAVLVASGVALYAGSYVPYHVMRVLNVYARLRWRARCPNFTSESAAVHALELRTYLSYQATRGLIPLAMCLHPLLYMAVAPSLGCCRRLRCPGCRACLEPEDTQDSGHARPLEVTAKTAEPRSLEQSQL
ncbi:P2Y purinoceptor 11, partial [Tupaia chinensis]|uniref:P2Y purinoceptor 11 n=1 Tax=Tupaia chinensis TaxID=246437 RepID=UPI000FFC9BA7